METEKKSYIPISILTNQSRSQKEGGNKILKLEQIFNDTEAREEKQSDPYREYIMKHTFNDNLECLILLDNGKLILEKCLLNLKFI